MKIYALTEMTELPNSCGDCNGAADGHKVLCFCRYSNNTLAQYRLSEIPTMRPEWCPLQTDKEIKESE